MKYCFFLLSLFLPLLAPAADKKPVISYTATVTLGSVDDPFEEVERTAWILRDRLGTVAVVGSMERTGDNTYLYEFTSDKKAGLLERILTMTGRLEMAPCFTIADCDDFFEAFTSMREEDPYGERLGSLASMIFPNIWPRQPYETALGFTRSPDITPFVALLDEFGLRGTLPPGVQLRGTPARDINRKFTDRYRKFPDEPAFGVYMVNPAAETFDWPVHIVGARALPNETDPYYYIEVTFDAEGSEEFSALTGRYTGDCLAIIIDGQVLSAPVVIEQITGGQMWVSSTFSLTDATAYMAVLSGGEAARVGITLDELTY